MEKNWKKRWMAGAMAFALCCTTLLQTGASAVSAAEVGGVSAQSETQIEVQTETQTETQTEKSEEELKPLLIRNLRLWLPKGKPLISRMILQD